MDHRLHIAALGDFKVTSEGRALALPPSKKTRALLGYLAVQGKPQRRERLCELFWDIPDDPRGALRWSLSKIRQIVDGERLIADRNTVHLDTSNMDVDFRRVASIRPADLKSKDTADLEELARVFRGDFLEDLALPRCPVYEAWRMGWFNQLRILRLSILRTLVERLADDPERALRYAHVLHRLEPDDATVAARIEQLTDGLRVALRESVDEPMPVAADAAAATRTAAAPARPFEREATARSQDVRFCTSADGTRIAFAVSGSGPPILRAAHWMTHLEYDWQSPVWTSWLDALSARGTLVRYDQRCSGLSDRGVADLSLDAMVADIAAVADAAGLDRFTLFGVSQSCAHSIAYAVRHPERLSGLVLYGGYARGWRKSGKLSITSRIEAIITLIRDGWGKDVPIFRQMFTSMFIPDGSREQADWYNELQRRTATPADAARICSEAADLDVTDLLAKIRVPTLVVHADNDFVSPLAWGKALAEGIPNARFVQVESRNHLLLGEEPGFQHFLNEVDRFLAETRSPEPAPFATVRRVVTALYVELVSPLADMVVLDFEQTDGAVERALGELGAMMRASGGIIALAGPNDLIAMFGADGRTEGHAVQACRAALAAAARLADSTAGSIRLRGGLDSGEMLVTQRADGPAGVSGGAAQGLARRMAHALRRDGIVLSQRTRELVEGRMEVEPVERRDLVGLPRDQQVFRLTGERRISAPRLAGGARLTPFVGRELELQMLRQALSLARAGQGGLVAVVADPGMGKSRLINEFIATSDLAGIRLIEVGAFELDAASPLVVAAALARALVGVGAEADRRAHVEALDAATERDALDRSWRDPLASLFGIPTDGQAWGRASPAEQVQRIGDAILGLLARAVETGPVLLVLEDLHWLDAASEKVLKRVISGLGARPVLTVATFRPEYPFALAAGGHQRLSLSSLDRRQSLAMIRSLLADGDGGERAAELLAEHSDGVPLFMEEMVRALAASGLPAAADLRYRLESVETPWSLQSVISASIERLPALDRQVLQLASVIGRTVRLDLLVRMASADAEAVRGATMRLRDAGLFHETRLPPDSEFTFKHSMLQRVAYTSMPAAERRTLHARFLGILESGPQDRTAERVEQLAWHSLRAEDWRRAAEYALASARHALQRAADSLALTHVRNGLESLEHWPKGAGRDALELQFRKVEGVAWMTQKGWGSQEVIEAYERAEALCADLHDTTELFNVLRGKAQYFMLRGEWITAAQLGRRCQALVEGSHDHAQHIETAHIHWNSCFFCGDYPGAERHARQAIALYSAEQHHDLTFRYSGHDPGVCARNFLSLVLLQRGKVAESEAVAEDARALAGRFGHPLTSGSTAWFGAFYELLRRDPERLLARAREGAAICARHQLAFLEAQICLLEGWAVARTADSSEGIRMMEAALAEIEQTGGLRGISYLQMTLAEIYAGVGRSSQALALIETAERRARLAGELMALPDILRTRAEILLGTGATERGEAEELLRSAIETAEAQGAALPALRAATSLAGQLAEAGRPDAAAALAAYRALVATAGDQPDARRAGALLQQIG